MKKTINGKTYNTDTAEQIAEWSNGAYSNDFHHCTEDLYKTKKGNYFLHGVGGPTSKYAEPCGGGNCRGSGSNITALTEQEALQWCEEHDAEEAIEKHFSHLTEEA